MIRDPRDAADLRDVHVAHLIETTGPGGAERMIAALASAQRAAGARATVFVPDTRTTWLESQLAGHDVSIERFPLASPVSPRCVRNLGAAFTRCGITLVHSHDFTMAVNGALTARANGLPHVITMHGGRYYAERLRRRLALRMAAVGSQAVVAVSDALAEHLCRDLRLARSRVLTIPNGVRDAAGEAVPLRASLGLDPDARLVVAVGNLYPVKGHRLLVAALATLPQHVHVVIAGRGAEEAALRALATALGVGHRVHLLGHREDVPGLLRAADIFAQPSLDEGLPLAVLEAMFAACAIVASEVGDVAQALGRGEAGVLVPPGDAGALAAAIGGLLSSPAAARALGEAARQRAEQRYGLAPMVARYTAVYAPLRDGGRGVTAWRPTTSPATQRSMRVNTSAKTGVG